MEFSDSDTVSTTYFVSPDHFAFYRCYYDILPDELIGEAIEMVNLDFEVMNNLKDRNIDTYEKAVEVKKFTKIIFNIYSRIGSWDESEEFPAEKILHLAQKLNILLIKVSERYAYSNEHKNPHRLLTHSYLHLITISKWLYDRLELSIDLIKTYEIWQDYLDKAIRVSARFNDNKNLFMILSHTYNSVHLQFREVPKNISSPKAIGIAYLYHLYVEKIFRLISKKEYRSELGKDFNGILYNKYRTVKGNVDKYGYYILTNFLMVMLERCGDDFLKFTDSIRDMYIENDPLLKNIFNDSLLIDALKAGIAPYLELLILLVENPEYLRYINKNKFKNNISSLINSFINTYKKICENGLHKNLLLNINSDVRWVIDVDRRYKFARSKQNDIVCDEVSEIFETEFKFLFNEIQRLTKSKKNGNKRN